MINHRWVGTHKMPECKRLIICFLLLTFSPCPVSEPTRKYDYAGLASLGQDLCR